MDGFQKYIHLNRTFVLLIHQGPNTVEIRMASLAKGLDESFTDVEATPLNEIAPAVAALRKSFLSGTTRDVSQRVANIKKLRGLIADNLEALVKTIELDLGRHASLTRKVLGGTLAACDVAVAGLTAGGWTEPREPLGQSHPYEGSAKIRGSFRRAEVRYCPRGTVLVIGTWNFPCPLVLKPLVSALAAGCTVVVKPNEVSPRSGTLLGRIIRELPSSVVRVVEGAIPEATELLRQKLVSFIAPSLSFARA